MATLFALNTITTKASYTHEEITLIEQAIQQGNFLSLLEAGIHTAEELGRMPSYTHDRLIEMIADIHHATEALHA